jgi:UPF0716 protein FxsA
MSLVKWGFIGLFLLPFAEIVAFVAIASLIGWGLAICLFVATSIVGVVILQRSGRDDLSRLRETVRLGGLRAVHLDSPGVGSILGGILLMFPGFITDVAGGILLIPAVRRQLRAMVVRAHTRRRRSQDPSVVDLTPEEWRQISEKRVKHQRPRRRIR